MARLSTRITSNVYRMLGIPPPTRRCPGCAGAIEHYRWNQHMRGGCGHRIRLLEVIRYMRRTVERAETNLVSAQGIETFIELTLAIPTVAYARDLDDMSDSSSSGSASEEEAMETDSGSEDSGNENTENGNGDEDDATSNDGTVTSMDITTPFASPNVSPM